MELHEKSIDCAYARGAFWHFLLVARKNYEPAAWVELAVSYPRSSDARTTRQLRLLSQST